MALTTTKELFKWAKANGKGICAFNVNNMELIQAVTEAANELQVPIILQVSKGARSYASPIYLKKLVEAACAATDIPMALHLDHGDSYELCKQSIDDGFTSVMIDGSHLPFDENIEITRKVVDYAKEFGASVEGELGQIAGIEEHVESEDSHYTDPKTVKEFVQKTGVSSLAVSIGTAHGAYKYKSEPKFRLDILAAIQKEIPNTPLVLHGASSVTQSDVETINKYGGEIVNALGAPEDILKQCIPLGVCKINIDSDLRLAFTAKVREYLTKNPTHFDPRQYLSAARAHVRDLIKRKLEIFTK